MPIFNDLQLRTTQGFQYAALNDFTGGLNLIREGLQLGSNESPDMCDVDLLGEGGICLRDAVRPFSCAPLPSPVCRQIMWEWPPEEGGCEPKGRYWVMALENGEVWVMSDDGGKPSRTDISAAAVDECGVCWDFCVVNERLYAHHPNEGSWCWECEELPQQLPFTVRPDFDSADTAGGDLGGVEPLGGSMPQAACCAVFSGFYWVAGVTEPDGTYHPNRIRRSFPLLDLEGEQDWGENDYIDVDIGLDGDVITALVPCGQRLYVFKKHSTYVIAGWNETNLQVFPVSQDIGACSKEAVACCDGVLFFYDCRGGLYVMQNDRPTYIGRNIDTAFENLDAETSEGVTVSCCERKLYVNIPGDRTFVWDFAISNNPVWTCYSLDIGAVEVWCPSGEVAQCVAYERSCGYLIALGDGEGAVDDLGRKRVPIPGYFCTRWFYGESPHLDKRWAAPDLLMQTRDGANIVTEVYADFDDSTVVCANTVSAEPTVSEAAPFILGGGDEGCSELTEGATLLEIIEPGADPTPQPCPQPVEGCDELKGPDATKTKGCGPDLTNLRSCAIKLCFRSAPSSTPWCICSLAIKWATLPFTRR